MTWRPENPHHWPAAHHELVLRAAIAPVDRALAAWTEFAERHDLDAIDGATLRILPLVYLRLREHGERVPELKRMRGVYRHTWARTQMGARVVEAAIRRFVSVGVPSILLKGGALICHYYVDHGARPMADFDVMVPRRDLPKCREQLAAEGWTPRFTAHVSRVPISHDEPWAHPSGVLLDLHWSLLPLGESSGPLDGVWERTEAIRIGMTETRSLVPTWLFAHVCVHGRRYTREAPLPWVADALTILHLRGGEIDWADLRAMASRQGLVGPLRDCLGYLADRFAAPIPRHELAAWQALTVTAADRRHDFLASRPARSLLERVERMAIRYRAAHRALGEPVSWSSFPELLPRVLSHVSQKRPRIGISP